MHLSLATLSLDHSLYKYSTLDSVSPLFTKTKTVEKENMVKDRTIGVALDFSNSSKNALKWALDNLADKGDTFYIIHISNDSPDESRTKLWAKSGSRKSNYY